MEWIIQKSVEIGVVRIVPVLMARCVVRLEPRDAEKKQDRWQKIAREAGKQSGRCLLPEVCLPVPCPRSAPGLAADLDACAVPWEEARRHRAAGFLAPHPDLHPWDPDRSGRRHQPLRKSICCRRFEPLTLGPRILRTETAGLAAAAAFLALAGEMEGCHDCCLSYAGLQSQSV